MLLICADLDICRVTVIDTGNAATMLICWFTDAGGVMEARPPSRLGACRACDRPSGRSAARRLGPVVDRDGTGDARLGRGVESWVPNAPKVGSCRDDLDTAAVPGEKVERARWASSSPGSYVDMAGACLSRFRAVRGRDV